MSHQHPQPSPDPARCPLCGQDNACAMAQAERSGTPQPPCWCTRAAFSASLLERVPDAAKGRACICARCAAQASA